MLFLMLLLYYCHPSHHFVWDNPCLVDLNDVPLADANSTWYLKPLLLLILTLVRIWLLVVAVVDGVIYADAEVDVDIGDGVDVEVDA